MASIRLRSGKLFDPLLPQLGAFTLDDIAWGLSGIYRWGAQSPTPVSVAQHCICVSLLVPARYRRAALLHDSAEALGLGDLPAPVKTAPEFAFYRDAERRILQVVGRQFGVILDPLPAAVKRADEKARVNEHDFAWQWHPVRATRETYYALFLSQFTLSK